MRVAADRAPAAARSRDRAYKPDYAGWARELRRCKACLQEWCRAPTWGAKARAQPQRLGSVAGSEIRRDAYLSAVWTEVKVVFSLEPRVPTTVMMATEMPAAMRPYSMAVAPDSSFTNLEKSFIVCASWPVSMVTPYLEDA